MSAGLVVSVLDRIAGRAVGRDASGRRWRSPMKPMLSDGSLDIWRGGGPVCGRLLRPAPSHWQRPRATLPGRGQSIPYYSYTKLEGVSPGQPGHPPRRHRRVVVALSGACRSRCACEARAGDTPVRATLPTVNDQAEWKSGALFDDFTYRVVAGDAMSDWYRIRVCCRRRCTASRRL